ncbi:MAG: DUF3854 domain-containing protein [Dethiobacter sp.]|jgi:hypothetical protein|nr:DUF3854 domain-containing protein [Dethiobacter sp.]
MITPKPFINARRDTPCPICGKTSWCGFNDEIAVCMRVSSGREVNNGGWLHKLDNVFTSYVPPKTRSNVKRKPDEFIDMVYREFIRILPLSEDHLQSLLERGMAEEEIRRRQYRTTPKDRHADSLGEKFNLYGVPGFFKENGRWKCVAAQGILIPVKNERRQIVGFQIRLDRKADNKKYVWFSSAKMGGSTPGPRIHVAMPQKIKIPDLVWITEGPLKADIAAERLGFPVLGVPGVNCWKSAIEVVKNLNPERAVVAYDSDYHKKQVSIHARALVDELKKHYKTGVALWPEEKGLDDALVAGVSIKVKVV